MIAGALGTLPTIHGMIAFLVSAVFIVLLRYAARYEGETR
jgi:hypothetical protein